MNRREKLLAAVTGLFVAAFLAYIVVDQWVLAPAAEYDRQARELTKKIAAFERYNRQKATFQQTLHKLAARSFGNDELQVGNDLVKRLKYLLIRSGLSNETQALSPVTGASLTGVYKEVGRSGRASGTLGNAIDFLYLLKNEPTLHRLDYVTISPKAGGRVSLHFKYSTLVLHERKGVRFPTSRPARPAREVDLQGDPRLQYNVIVARDLFRPYIKRPPVVVAQRPAPPPRRPTPPPRRPTTPPVSAGRFKVVALSTWAGQQEVIVRDVQTGQTRTYKLGSPLASGKIIMIDYRQLPRPDKPLILSPSRVIIQIGQDYWAIELGQSLAHKRRLKAEQLPERLRAAAEASTPGKEAADKGRKET